MNIVSLFGNGYLNLDLLVKAQFFPREVGPKPASSERLAQLILIFAIPLPVRKNEQLTEPLYQTILHGEDAEKVHKIIQQMRVK